MQSSEAGYTCLFPIQSRDKGWIHYFNNEAIEVVRPTMEKSQLFRAIKSF